jgi:hypothetical protein
MASTLSGRFHTIHTDAMIAMTIKTPTATRTFNNLLRIGLSLVSASFEFLVLSFQFHPSTAGPWAGRG